jgi:hypothetical protein
MTEKMPDQFICYTYIRIGPRAIRYDLEQLDDYIDRNTVKKEAE